MKTDTPAVAKTENGWPSHLAATGLCVAVALVSWPLARWLDLANIVMLFLLAVVIAAVRLGRGPAIVAAFLSVALFDFFFVPPQFSFAVNDVQYLVTFAVMLVVALIIGQLTTSLKARADDAVARAAEQSGLYRLAQELAGTLTVTHTISATAAFVAQQLGAHLAVLLPDAQDELQLAALDAGDAKRYQLSANERAAARAVYHSATTVDAPELGRDDGERMLLPLIGATRSRGVMIVAAASRASAQQKLSAHGALLRAVASLFTTAIERLHYVDVASKSELEMQSERLRASILAAISHDVRTPLTALYGLADTLASDPALTTPQTHETAINMRDQAMQLNNMVTNLLDMARLQAGRVTLRREWQPLDEVVGASIRFAAPALKLRHVKTSLAPDLPLVNIDAVLMERVLSNLLENAAKYSPDASVIALAARALGSDIEVSIANAGKGFAPDRMAQIFTLFERGEPEAHASGMGVGLAICRAIVEAHGGHIIASNPPEGGACVSFTLPRGMPPDVDLDAGLEAGST